MNKLIIVIILLLLTSIMSISQEAPSNGLDTQDIDEAVIDTISDFITEEEEDNREYSYVHSADKTPAYPNVEAFDSNVAAFRTVGVDPLDLEVVDYSQVQNRYVSFIDVDDDAIVEYSRLNEIYLLDKRYNEAIRNKKIARGFFIGTSFSTILFTTLSILTLTSVIPRDDFTHLEIFSTAMASLSAFGGVIPSTIIWHVESIREVNLLRRYHNYEEEITFFDFYEDDTTNYLESPIK